MPQGHQPILELHGITKAFGGVEALRGVDFALSAGEIHGLVGENGAGKSTLMKIIAGVHADFSGRFVLDGRETRFRSVRDARAAGIAMVHQELSVAPDLSVAENVFLGSQPTNRFGLVQWRRMAREAGEQLKRFGIDVDPLSRLGDLPIGLQQLIEIARVLFSGARIIILDEPTSALSPPEVERLFATLAAVARRRHQHRLHFAFHRRHPARLRHRDGVPQRPEGRRDAGRRDQQGGADRGDDRQGPRGARRDLHARHHAAAARRSAGGVERKPAVARPQPAGRLVRGPLRRSPRHLRLHGLRPARTGADPVRQAQARPWRACGGRRAQGLRQHRRCAGAPASPSFPRAAAPCCSTRSRSTRTSRSASSIAFRRCFSSRRANARSPTRQVEQLQIRPAAVELDLGMLSGGNQQKVALAKWLSYPPRLLVLCEPTRGMDVGAKNDVIHIIRDLRAQGLGHHRAFDRAGDGAVARRSRHRAQARRGGAGICQRTDQQGPPAGSGVRRRIWRPVKA